MTRLRRNSAGALHTPDQPDIYDSRSPRLAPRLALLIVATVYCGFCLVGLLNILLSELGPLPTGVGMVYMVIMASLQLSYVTGRQHRPWVSYVRLGVQAVLAFLPFLQFGQAWSGMPGFLAGSCLLVLPTAWAWIAFALIVAAEGAVQAVITGHVLDIAYVTVSTIITGLVVFGLARLAGLVTELHAARTELARLAVTQERLRFARDLHDLLGYSISAITLKSELTHQLVTKNPTRAREEIAEILDISRRALTDVRAVASGYRELSFEEESISAQSVLTAANVAVTMDVSYSDVPTATLTVLATLLREGVTNILRHSKAEHCQISVRQVGGNVELEIINDGVVADLPTSDSGGNGIRNMSERVAARHGKVVAGPVEPGRFRLYASIPTGPGLG